jgi:hypothetical protein
MIEVDLSVNRPSELPDDIVRVIALPARFATFSPQVSLG